MRRRTPWPDLRALLGAVAGEENFLRSRTLVAFSQANQVKGGLAQIDADGCDVHCDDPLDVNRRAKSHSASDDLINPDITASRASSNSGLDEYESDPQV